MVPRAALVRALWENAEHDCDFVSTDDAEVVFRGLATRRQNFAVRLPCPNGSGARDRISGIGDCTELFQLMAEDPDGINKEDLSNVYDRVLVRGKGARSMTACGRAQVSPALWRAGRQNARSLSAAIRYPEFAVFPANLVPAVRIVTKSNRNMRSRTRRMTFHPYFTTEFAPDSPSNDPTTNTVQVSLSTCRLPGV